MEIIFDKSWMDDTALNELAYSIESSGGLVYLVGGCVRDSILGRKIVDIDFATDLLPETVIKSVEKSGFRVNRKGVPFGTVTVINKKKKFEVTTFRSDIKTDGRGAIVKFTSNLSLDAMRRDFTMNSIYLTLSGEIVDPLGSLSDLLEKRVRFIGKPSARIKEDKLRILRYFRFLAEFNQDFDAIDGETLEALLEYGNELKYLSKERIWAEFKRILSADNPHKIIKIMLDLGILCDIFPEVDVKSLVHLVKLEKRYEIGTPPIYRLFCLNKTLGGKWANFVSLTRREAKTLYKLKHSVENYKDLIYVAYRFGREIAEAWLLNSDNGSYDFSAKEIRQLINNGANARFPVRGSDLIVDIGEGPQVGKELARLEEVWLKSGFRMSKNELLHGTD